MMEQHIMREVHTLQDFDYDPKSNNMSSRCHNKIIAIEPISLYFEKDYEFLCYFFIRNLNIISCFAREMKRRTHKAGLQSPHLFFVISQIAKIISLRNIYDVQMKTVTCVTHWYINNNYKRGEGFEMRTM